VEFSGPTLESVTAKFPAPGEYTIRLTATDGVLTASDVTTIDVTAAPFEAWRSAAFTAEELANDAISGARADPDGDGLCNDAEYFFGSDPKVPAKAPPTAVRIAGGRLQIDRTQRRRCRMSWLFQSGPDRSKVRGLTRRSFREERRG
jgi:hypothetical protein